MLSLKQTYTFQASKGLAKVKQSLKKDIISVEEPELVRAKLFFWNEKLFFQLIFDHYSLLYVCINVMLEFTCC